MPFVETNPVNERNKMIDDWLSRKFTKTELARAYGISRPTWTSGLNASRKRVVQVWKRVRQRLIVARIKPIRRLRK